MSELVNLLPQAQVTTTQLTAKVTQGTGITITSPGSSIVVSLSVPVIPAWGGTGLTATPGAGQVLIGTGASYALGTLTPGTGISIANAAGSITIGLASGNTVTPLGSATAHQWVSYIDSSGTQHLSQPGFTDLTGTIASGQFPGTIAPVQPVASPTAHQWVTNITATGVQVTSQPGFTDLTGTIASGQFPVTIAPVVPLSAATTNAWVQYIDASGTQHLVQPGFTNLSGTIASGQFPGTIAPVQPVASATAHQWLTHITATGLQVTSQPNFTDIAGTLSSAQFPGTIAPVQPVASATAHQWVTNITATGLQVTSQPGFSDLTGTLSSSQYGSQAAFSWFGNPTSSTANPTFNTTQIPNTLINWASPGPIGSTTPNTGTFSTLTFGQLAQPSITSVVSNGTTGSSTWGYSVVAHYLDGTNSPASAQVTTTGANGNATLTGTNSQTINWSAVPGANYYTVYRTLIASGGSPSTTGIIANNILTTTYTDTGTAGNGAIAPSVNTSGFVQSGAAGGPVDVRIGRASVGTMEIDSGTQGQFGDLTLSGIALRGIAQGPGPVPSVSPVGGAAGTYSYVAVPVDAGGLTGQASNTVTITNGPTTLNGSTYNVVTAPTQAVCPGATSFLIYRTAGGSSLGKIASLAPGASINDTNLVGDYTVAPLNSQLCSVGFDSAHTGKTICAIQPFFNKWTEGDSGLAVTDGFYGNYADIAASDFKAISAVSPTVAPTIYALNSGASPFSYVIVGVDGSGNQTAPSPAGSITASLSGPVWNNLLTWTPFYNSSTALNGQIHAYQIFRTVGGTSQGLIGTVPVENANGSVGPGENVSGQFILTGMLSFFDSGLAANAAVTYPKYNQTGAVRLYNADLNQFSVLQCGPENCETGPMNGATTFPWTTTPNFLVYDPNTQQGGYVNAIRMTPPRQAAWDLYDDFFYPVSPGASGLAGSFYMTGTVAAFNPATSGGFSGGGNPGYVQLKSGTGTNYWASLSTSLSVELLTNYSTIFESLVSIDILTGHAVIRSGIMDTLREQAITVANGAYFTFSTGSLIGSVSRGGTVTNTASLLTPATNGIYYLRIEAGGGTSTVRFYVKQVGSGVINTASISVAGPSGRMAIVPLIVSNATGGSGVSQAASIDFVNFHQELLTGRF